MFEWKSAEKFGFHNGLALGVFLGLVACALTYGITSNWSISQETFADLALGITAVGAAFFSIRSVSNQAAQQRELEEKRNRARERSQRASLPFHLANIQNVVEKHIAWYCDTTRPTPCPFEDITSDMEGIKRLIEVCDTQSANYLSSVISQIQVLNTRTLDFVKKCNAENASGLSKVGLRNGFFMDTFIRLGVLQAGLGKVYGYARGSSPSISAKVISRCECENAIRKALFDEIGRSILDDEDQDLVGERLKLWFDREPVLFNEMTN